jgi:hypothetical protein
MCSLVRRGPNGAKDKVVVAAAQNLSKMAKSIPMPTEMPPP